MTKEAFRELCSKKNIYLDGATGSNLQKAGMPSGVCPETWILEHEETLIALQKAYVDEGSDIIYAPTFTSNRVKLAEYGLENQIEEINTKLVQMSKKAVGSDVLVAGDITMTGRQLKPIGTLEFEELIDIYKEQIRFLEAAGVDLLVIETMMSLQEARAAAIAAMEVSDLPVMVTLTFEKDGRTLFGSDAKSAAIALTALSVDAIGANCSTGPAQMCEVIKAMAEVTELPLIAKANAGLPALNEAGETVYSMDCDTFAKEMMQIVESGASILGGCCGTSPEYIKALVDKTKDMKVKRETLTGKRFLCSERQALCFTLEDPFMIVGERINPTGKKKLQVELKVGSLDMVSKFAQEQEECGAKVLDINMGMSGIDEKEMMLTVLEEVAGITSLPLAIDSSHVDVIEAALRKYPGRALINSISYESAKVDVLLPLAKKYGAMFILLPLSDAGLPKDLEEKKEIIHKILEKAFALGMTKDDIIVDGLVTTVAANPMAARETLETIHYCKKMGLATICGLSNISFGLPERSNVNSAFLTMAIQAGLTMAIANPNQEVLVNAALTADLLMAKEGGDLAYIERMNNLSDKITDVMVGKTSNTVVELSPLEKVKEAVLKGKQREILLLTQKVIEEGVDPQDVLNKALLPAINEVGDLFDCGKYFLPQLIASAETMKKSIEYLEPMLKEEGDEAHMPTVVIATVKGDIHDIGKNLVALMLKNHGFQIVDLGKDVSKEEIIKAAKEHKAGIIALSALMTTTMQEMKQVIAYAKAENVDAKIMIGGAVITQEYADEIGANGYSKDAAEAVKLAQKLCADNK